MQQFNMYQYQNSNLIFDNDEKIKKFLCDIEKFEQIKTLDEAKKLSNKIFPNMDQKINKIYLDNFECTILIESNLFRLSVDSPQKFISYSFTDELKN